MFYWLITLSSEYIDTLFRGKVDVGSVANSNMIREPIDTIVFSFKEDAVHKKKGQTKLTLIYYLSKTICYPLG